MPHRGDHRPKTRPNPIQSGGAKSLQQPLEERYGRGKPGAYWRPGKGPDLEAKVFSTS